jgi:hypothetical protein
MVHDVTIIGMENGVALSIGCKWFAVTEDKVDEMLHALKKLIVGGIEAEEELRRKYCPGDFEHPECEAVPTAGRGEPREAPPALYRTDQLNGEIGTRIRNRR